MKKKIEELFRLAMKAQEKTSAYVSFETSNHGWGCAICFGMGPILESRKNLIEFLKKEEFITSLETTGTSPVIT